MYSGHNNLPYPPNSYGGGMPQAPGFVIPEHQPTANTPFPSYSNSYPTLEQGFTGSTSNYNHQTQYPNFGGHVQPQSSFSNYQPPPPGYSQYPGNASNMYPQHSSPNQNQQKSNGIFQKAEKALSGTGLDGIMNKVSGKGHEQTYTNESETYGGKKKNSKKNKLVKYGVPIAGVAVGAYALKKIF